MKILIDSREQNPLTFLGLSHVTDEIVTKLDVGDYGCTFKNGYTPPVYFERKALGDLFSTLTSGYKRFKQEILRAKDNDVKLYLLIEATILDVQMGANHSTVKGDTILKTINTLWLKYDLVPFFMPNGLEMSLFIQGFYSAIGRKALKDLKAKAT